MDSDEMNPANATRLRWNGRRERKEAVERLEAYARRVVEACERYDELVEVWEDRGQPSFERLCAVLGDPNVRAEKLELAVVGLSLLDRTRARAALRWFEPLPGQPSRIEDLVKVALFEWRLRWAEDEPVAERPRVA